MNSSQSKHDKYKEEHNNNRTPQIGNQLPKTPSKNVKLNNSKFNLVYYKLPYSLQQAVSVLAAAAAEITETHHIFLQESDGPDNDSSNKEIDGWSTIRQEEWTSHVQLDAEIIQNTENNRGCGKITCYNKYGRNGHIPLKYNCTTRIDKEAILTSIGKEKGANTVGVTLVIDTIIDDWDDSPEENCAWS